GERRLRTLRELAARTTEEARSAEEACQTAARTLADNSRDVPFALVYLLDEKAGVAHLVGATGLPEGSPAAPRVIERTRAATGGEGGVAAACGPGIGAGGGRRRAGGAVRAAPMPTLARADAAGRRRHDGEARAGPARRVRRGRDQPPAAVRRRLQGVPRPAG